MRTVLVGLVWAVTSAFMPVPSTIVTMAQFQSTAEQCVEATCLNSAQGSTVQVAPAAAGEAIGGVTLTLAGDHGASATRLRSGDRLLKLNREEVNSLAEIEAILAAASKQSPRPVDILLSRHGDLVFLTVSLQELQDVLISERRYTSRRTGSVAERETHTKTTQLDSVD